MARLGHALPRQTPAKRWVTLLALLAFFLQSLTVQTHIHQLIQPFAAKAAPVPAPTPLKTQDPLDQCRLCQELAHAGSFFAPPAAVLVISLNFISAIFVPLREPADSSAKPFAWQSRAPPRR